jgi:hypothetical protein
VEGIVVCFLKVSLFGAYTTLFKNKKYMLFSRRCGSFLKKNNHTSHPNTHLIFHSAAKKSKNKGKNHPVCIATKFGPY